MVCSNCGSLELRVVRTLRFKDYDLRETYCPKCKHFEFQESVRITEAEFKDLEAKGNETKNENSEVLQRR